MTYRVRFLSFPSEVFNLTKGSKYFKVLSQLLDVQQYKNGVRLTDTANIARTYAEATSPVPLRDRGVILQAVNKLYSKYALPSVTFHFVLVDTKVYNLEMALPVSFTVNTVVFLNTKCKVDEETVVHECVHVLQRVSPSTTTLYRSLGYRPCTEAERSAILHLCESQGYWATLNPDDYTLFLDPQSNCVLYDLRLRKLVVNLQDQTCRFVGSRSTTTLWGHTVKVDSINEMIAYLVAKLPDCPFTL